ncbi:hypothetical protein [uncultured Treponema sp.]|uniref:hypothetical protein n=1 Tax=uncultured Treponema sp. TaxID=162155 RepID=UPI0025DDBC2C|nr:hypothetical protein [uncultured Treponema sp.]
MKKIVSVLAFAALTLSAVFAADISLSYRTRANVYSETKTKKDGAVTASSKTVLDQTGYGTAAKCFVLSASGDVGGFILDVDPNAGTEKFTLDQWYAWVNLGNLQTTVGLWKSRYVNRVTEDANDWQDADYERYKPGVIGGVYAKDIDNLTYSTLENHQKLSTAFAYTIRPNDDTYFMVKGVLVNAGGTNDVKDTWGGALMNSDSGNYQNTFFSGFAGEVAFKVNNVFDFNVAARSEKRNSLGVGVFLRPLMFDSANLLFGFSYGRNLADYGDTIESNYSEFAIDFRARIKLSEKLALTTMNNMSSFTDAKTKDATIDPNKLIRLWDMVSLAYKASEQLLLQCTVESECAVYARGAGTDDAGKPKNVDYYVGDLGGINLSVIPGMTWTFNANAKLTAGLKFDFGGIRASADYKAKNEISTGFSIPVVFKVVL